MTPLLLAAALAPAAPPADGLLVPAARTGGRADLYLVAPATGDARNLTKSEGVEELYPAWSPDGTRIAFVGRDQEGSIEVWACDADGGNRVAVSHPPEGGGRSGCFAPSWSPDGKRIVYARGTPDDRFHLYVAAADGSKDTLLRAGGCCPAWSPDGSGIAFVRREPGKPFALMTVAPDGTGERLLVPDLGGVGFADPAWSPDGSVIAYPAALPSYGWQLYLIPAAGGTPRQLTHLAGVNVNPVWVARDRLLFGHFTQPGAPGAYLTIKADGTRLEAHPLTKTDPAHPLVRPAAWVPRPEPRPAKPDNPVRQAGAVEAAKPPVTLAPMTLLPGGGWGSVTSAVWAAGDSLVVGTEAGEVAVLEFDPAKGLRAAAGLKGHQGPVVAVAPGVDPGTIYSAGADGSARVWDVAKRGTTAIETDHGAAVEALAASPNGRLIATGDADGMLKLRDAATGKPTREVKASGAKRAAVQSLAFGKGGETLFAGCGKWDVPVLGGSLAAFDPETGKERWRTVGMMGGVFALAASPDGDKLAGACLDGLVRVWDAATGKERACWKGHADRVTGVSWSPDGRWVASSGFDHTVRVWDASSGSLLQTLACHAAPAIRVAFAPDGKHLVSTGRDGAVVVWKVTAE